MITSNYKEPQKVSFQRVLRLMELCLESGTGLQSSYSGTEAGEFKFKASLQNLTRPGFKLKISD